MLFMNGEIGGSFTPLKVKTGIVAVRGGQDRWLVVVIVLGDRRVQALRVLECQWRQLVVTPPGQRLMALHNNSSCAAP